MVLILFTSSKGSITLTAKSRPLSLLMENTSSLPVKIHAYMCGDTKMNPDQTEIKAYVTVSQSYELFHCQDVSMAIPWPSISDPWALQDTFAEVQDAQIDHFEVSTEYHSTTPVEEANGRSGCSNSPLNGKLSGGANGYLFDRMSVTWPEEKLVLASKNRRPSPRVSVDLSNGLCQNKSAWGIGHSDCRP